MSKKTEAAIIKAAMLRYEQLAKVYQVKFADVVAGNKPITMTDAKAIKEKRK
jgi:hypothetical protein